MSQQNPLYTEDRNYKRRLFYDNGLRFVEVQAKQIKEYRPPAPVMRSKVNQHLQSPAGILNLGTSYYTISLSMLFYSKKDYADWLLYVGAEHKYYDEKGSIFVGTVTGTPTVESVEQETKYIVVVEFAMVRKADFEYRGFSPFIDIEGHWAKNQIKEMAERGLIAQYWQDGDDVEYFRPEDKLLRSEAAAFLVRTFKYVDKLLRGF